VGTVGPIGIGGGFAAPPLPHHRTYGSVYGGSVILALAGWRFETLSAAEGFTAPQFLSGFTLSELGKLNRS
jgi:hypothetical protein